MCARRSCPRWRSATGRPGCWLLARVQRRVEPAPRAAARQALDRARLAVAAKEQVRGARQLAGLDDLPVGHAHAGAGGQVEARLDHAVVAERDAEARVGAQQAALAEWADLPAA